MADVIKITPERLKDEASKVRNYREEHDNAISRLTNLVMSLCDTWDGEAQMAFVSSYENFKPKLDKFSQTLEKYAQDMDKISNKMQTTDQSLAGKIRSLN